MSEVEYPSFRDLVKANFNPDPPQNGAVAELPMDRYRSLPGLAPSDLKVASEDLGWKQRGHLSKLATSRLCDWCDANNAPYPPGLEKRKKSSAFRFGDIYHGLLLQPAMARQQYIVMDDAVRAELVAKRIERKKTGKDWPTEFNPRWKESIAGKKAAGRELDGNERAFILKARQDALLNEWSEYCDRSPETANWIDENQRAGKTLVSSELFQHASRMVEALYELKENTEVGEYMRELTLDTSNTEVSLFYEERYNDRQPSIQMKGRPDAIVPDGILDPKTAYEIHPDVFARTVEDFGYDVSMATYIYLTERLAGHETCEALDFPKKRAGFLAQMKSPPYLARIYWIPEDWLNFRKNEARVLYSQLAAIWGKGRWSGDLMKEQVQELLPSPWLQTRMANFG